MTCRVGVHERASCTEEWNLKNLFTKVYDKMHFYRLHDVFILVDSIERVSVFKGFK